MEEEYNETVGREMTKVNQRISEGQISREISYSEIVSGNPSKERVLGRLEAYLPSRGVIDSEDLVKVFREYGINSGECKGLVSLAHRGIIEGLVQEPDNMPNYGVRMGCFSLLASYSLEDEIKKAERGKMEENIRNLFEESKLPNDSFDCI